jgi:hypothetical protein
MKFDIWVFFEKKTYEKIQVSLKSDKNNGYCTWRLDFFLIIYRSDRLRMRNVSDKSCRGDHNLHFVFNNLFLKKIVPFMR